MYKEIEYYNQKSYENLSDKAYDIIEELLVTMVLKPGQIFSEKELMELTGIGRTPVREAIQDLEHTHLIEVIPRRGVAATPIRLDECSLQLEVRNILEKLVCVRAARFATPQEREELKELGNRYRTVSELNDALALARIDNEFNHFVADCAKNIFAKGSLMPLQALAKRVYFMQYYVNPKLTNEINQCHIRLIDSIVNADEEVTVQCLDQLRVKIKELTSNNLEQCITLDDIYQNMSR